MTIEIREGDCVEVMKTLPAACFDACVCDPPYPEVVRPYGKLSVEQWFLLMQAVVEEVRRLLKPKGSAVFILQPNSESVGRVRPWLFDFMAWIARDWNMPQDVWWWNPASAPSVHCQRRFGLMRPSVKACVWGGASDCYRDQSSVLWTTSDAMKAVDREDRILRTTPSGFTIRKGRAAKVADERGGVTPFNLLPFSNTNSSNSGGAAGHGAATPLPLVSWWLRYIVPPGGAVLDPFAGSGTTGIAAKRLGLHALLIEKEELPWLDRGLDDRDL
jgi:DNA modification methylase